MKAFEQGAGAILRAIGHSFDGLGMTVEEIRSRRWASATFTGARHELTFRVEGAGAGAAVDRFLANLDAAEFDTSGHIVADIGLVSDERRDGSDWVRLQLEALTVDEG